VIHNPWYKPKQEDVQMDQLQKRIAGLEYRCNCLENTLKDAQKQLKRYGVDFPLKQLDPVEPEPATEPEPKKEV